ncbi:MAG: protein-L-isoaspartate(D-aspartate) O-methyltransferase [Luteitalea sp.]|nr:protein-L-isoaspartate(D-aspartate) O-methyltransferase [Luteitalea sp.]
MGNGRNGDAVPSPQSPGRQGTSDVNGDWRGECERMVQDQIAARGLRDARVLSAMREVPRHLFVPAALRQHAYDDGALPIGEGQTISQPYIVAAMTEAARLRQGDRVLEIGTGSGYQAAVLGRLVDQVLSIERMVGLARRAHDALQSLGLEGVHLVVADGVEALRPGLVFDAVIVTAGAPAVSDRLRARLADGGRLIIPVGPLDIQTLLLVERQGRNFTESSLGGCVFVPLIGRSGWSSPQG